MEDLITIALVLLCVWTFIPRHMRVALRSGLTPAVVALSEAVLEGARIAGKVLTHIAYRGLLGVPVPPPIMGKLEAAEEEKEVVATPVADNDNDSGQLVATPNNAINKELSDNAAFDGQIAQLARLYESGQVTNLAKAIEKGFNCSRSSKEDSTYMQVRRALDKHLVKGPQFRQEDGTTAPATRPVTGRRSAA